MKLVKVNKYFYILSDEEISGVGYRMDMKRMSVGVIDDDNYYNRYPDDFKKIIASNDETLGIPLIKDEEIEIVIGEMVNIEKLAAHSLFRIPGNSVFSHHPIIYIKGFSDGYSELPLA